jgi:peroxiredoxin
MVMFALFGRPTMRPLLLAVVLALSTSACARGTSSLPLGSPAPDFTLPGADGKSHSLRDYAGSRVLGVVFTCNTCPTSQLYEARLQRLHDEYRGRGVTVLAINANKPDAVRLADLRYTDVGESLDDMKVRAAHRHIGYPYVSDGQTQTMTRQFGVVTTPHIFIFDQDRKLQYEGRIDDDPREELAKAHDARNAIDALLDGRRVPVTRTPVEGCPIKGLSTSSQPDEELARVETEPVPLDMAGADDLKRLRQNGTGKLLLINFWATWCAPCASEFPDLEATYRMFKSRNLEFVTVSVNDPEERAAVHKFLQSHHSSHRNLLFATSDVYGLQAAFDPKMPAPVPFTIVLAPNGDVVYQELGELDAPKLRRAILANLPDDPKYPGLQAYWSNPTP